MEYKYQLNSDDLRVQYSIIYSDNPCQENDLYESFLSELGQVYDDIDNLTNHADGHDYALAVSSGIITGFIDMFFVGEWNFKELKDNANKDINKRILEFAKQHNDYQKYCDKALESKGGSRRKPKDPNRLETAISYLEWKYPFPGDDPWNHTGYDKYGAIIKDKKISAKSHHLDDISHHPTLIGLLASIMAQFKQVGTYYNKDNQEIKIPFSVDSNGLIEGKTPTAKISAGIINWCFTVAKNRRGHLMSDLGGSKQTAGNGMGLPGTILSTLKELSSLPCFDNPNFSNQLADAYQNGIGTNKGQVNLGMFNCFFEGASSKFDYRTENAIKRGIKKQTVPVAINETIVRTFYFIRHFIIEMKEKGSLEKINLKKIIPLNNRTIVRMISISSGVLSAIDIADASLRAAAESNGNCVVFGSKCLLRVNFVGIGRFSTAITTDYVMGIRKDRLEYAITYGELAKTALFLEETIHETDRINKEAELQIKMLEKMREEISTLKF